MKRTTRAATRLALAALLGFALLLAACEGTTTNNSGGGDDDAATGSGADASVGAADTAGGGEDDTGAPVCEPDCAGKECGDDGCGGACGSGCAAEETCTNFQCVVPDACTVEDALLACEGRECGGDGCGGICGSCDVGSQCDLTTGRCMCQADCSALECGPDPVCGVSCGICPDGGTCTDGVCEADYPAGPYGTEVGDTIDNLTFYTAEGRPVELAQFYGQEKVIILTSAAGWCSVCRDEAIAFEEFWGLYDDRGLIIIYTLFEDDTGAPIDGDFVRAWVNAFDLTYPVYQDRDLAMVPFYDQNATPLNMVVTTADMQIRYREVGYSDFQVTYWAKKYIFE